MTDSPAAPADADAYAPPPLPQNLIETTSPISGFWRRLGAFFIDAIVLGVAGMVIGLLAFDLLATMGWLARLVGFVVALAYAGLLNSRLSGGQTLGKRILEIRVVRLDGSLLSVPRAMARQVVFSLPFFLNNFPFSPKVLTSGWMALDGLVVFGGLFAIFYLFTFNRSDRRSLHDYAVGSVVARELPTSAPLSISPIWRGHVIVVGIVAFLALLAPIAGSQLQKTETFAGIMPLFEAMSSEPGVVQASANVGTTFGTGGNHSYVSVVLQRNESNTEDEDFARKVARDVLRVYPKAAQVDRINVSLSYGYDMVIASSWRSNTYAFAPADLRE